jgi:hypothetical protein
VRLWLFRRVPRSEGVWLEATLPGGVAFLFASRHGAVKPCYMSATEQAEKRVSLDTSMAKASSENRALTQRWKRCSTQKQAPLIQKPTFSATFESYSLPLRTDARRSKLRLYGGLSER